MFRQTLKVTQIKDFYVCSLVGLKLGETLIPFGELVDLSSFSPVLRQNFYDRGFVGSYEQFLSRAKKFRPSKLTNLLHEKDMEYIDIVENLNSNKAKIKASGRGANK